MLRGTKRLSVLLNRASFGVVGGNSLSIPVEARTFSLINLKCFNQYENPIVHVRDSFPWISCQNIALSSVATQQVCQLDVTSADASWTNF